MRLWWALKQENYKKIIVITLHFNLGVRYKGHLISYLNSKDPNCGKG